MTDFTFCQQQYFIKRVMGMKEPQNDNMLRGTNVHESVDVFYQTVNVSSAKELSYSDIRTYFKSCFPEPSEISDQDEFHLDEDLHIDRYITAEMDRLLRSEPDNFLPSGNETPLEIVTDIEVDGVSQPVHFLGIIDRIFTNPDGTLHIHELKTGLWKDKPYKYEAMRKEMAFYVWLLRKTDTSAQITHWGWDHTKGVFETDTEDAEVFRFVEPVRVKELGLMIADVQTIIRTHRRYKGDGEASMFSLLPPGAQFAICDPWCAVKEFCPRYQEPVGGDE